MATSGTAARERDRDPAAQLWQGGEGVNWGGIRLTTARPAPPHGTARPLHADTKKRPSDRSSWPTADVRSHGHGGLAAAAATLNCLAVQESLCSEPSCRRGLSWMWWVRLTRRPSSDSVS